MPRLRSIRPGIVRSSSSSGSIASSALGPACFTGPPYPVPARHPCASASRPCECRASVAMGFDHHVAGSNLGLIGGTAAEQHALVMERGKLVVGNRQHLAQHGGVVFTHARRLDVDTVG